MGSRYRCRVSPSGVPGCIPGTGTGGTGEEEFTLAGGLALVGPTDPFSTEALNVIPLSSPLWLPRTLDGFMDLGNGQLQYIGDLPRIFMIVGGVSFQFLTAEFPDALFLTYGINGTNFMGEVNASTAAVANSPEYIGISEIVTLVPNDIIELYATTSSGNDFILGAGQLSISAAGP